MSMDKDNFNANVDFVRGQADMIVLSALSDSDKYGLEILSTIQERSKGMYSLKQATLYSSLKRLEKNGYVHSFDGEISNGAKRVYYGLTQMGREHLENDKSYWEFCNFLMSNLISDNMFDPDHGDKPFDPAEFRPLTRRARGEKEDKEQDKDQDKEKEVVVKYVYVKSDDIPEGADVVYVSPENIQDLNDKSNQVDDVNSQENSVNAQESDVNQSTTQEITTLSDSEYQPSFLLVEEERVEESENNNEDNQFVLIENSANEISIIEENLQLVDTTAQLESNESQFTEESTELQVIDSQETVINTQETSADSQESVIGLQETVVDLQETIVNLQETIVNLQETVANLQDSQDTTLIEIDENNQIIEQTQENLEAVASENSESTSADDELQQQYSTSIETTEITENQESIESLTVNEVIAVEETDDNSQEATVLEESEESVIEEVTSDVYEEQTSADYYQEPVYAAEQTQVEDGYASSSFADRPLHNSAEESSSQFSSLFSNYSRENDVNYVESFSELFDVEDEDDSSASEVGTDIEFLSMKEMVYKYQSKGINIKPYDKRNTMEYYVNRYYFSNKLHFHASIIIFAIFAFELFIGHFICNRGANKISDLWLLMIFALAIFPAIRSVMYVIDPTRKSLANYNAKTSFLISLLPVVTFPIVFALMGFVQFGANINDYASMERTIILPSVLLFNVPLFSIIYTLLYRTYKYHVN